MIVVPVLITNCHVSEKPKIGPLTSQMTMTKTAKENVLGRPVTREMDFAICVYRLLLAIPSCCTHGWIGQARTNAVRALTFAIRSILRDKGR